jgi:hypothetical protein
MKEIGLGDLLDALFHSSGFQDWFKANYTCKCDKRRALYNYIKVMGPEWLSNWIQQNVSRSTSD